MILCYTSCYTPISPTPLYTVCILYISFSNLISTALESMLDTFCLKLKAIFFTTLSLLTYMTQIKQLKLLLNIFEWTK